MKSSRAEIDGSKLTKRIILAEWLEELHQHEILNLIVPITFISLGSWLLIRAIASGWICIFKENTWPQAETPWI